MEPATILFDWDNTLVDTWPTIHKALKETFENFGMQPWTMDEVKERVGRSMREAFPEVFGDRWEEAAKIYQNSYRAHHLDKLSAIEGAENTLSFFKDQQYAIGLVSNKRGDTLRQEVDHIGWNEYFSAIVGAGDAKRDKPSPDPILLALDMLELNHTTPIWYVGDSIVDLEVAANTGALPVLFGEKTDGSIEGTKYRGYDFVHHARNHGELLQLVKNSL